MEWNYMMNIVKRFRQNAALPCGSHSTNIPDMGTITDEQLEANAVEPSGSHSTHNLDMVAISVEQFEANAVPPSGDHSTHILDMGTITDEQLEANAVQPSGSHSTHNLDMEAISVEQFEANDVRPSSDHSTHISDMGVNTDEQLEANAVLPSGSHSTHIPDIGGITNKQTEGNVFPPSSDHSTDIVKKILPYSFADHLKPRMRTAIKSHQIEGIEFMLQNIMVNHGCILPHSMGLGKTVQVIGLCDIFLSSSSKKRVLILMPVNTIRHFVAEFDHWLPLQPDNSVDTRSFNVYKVTDCDRSLKQRSKILLEWYQIG
ncbi:Helicase ARIP4, partial [Pseudolycoriella hygida]